ncbi:MAG: GNAT family N-acetyltransferase [Deltaproteobacteria bacterium]|nr:GNAT family N-acetyltransferase [Deltaproteobacteria bacterium]
MNDHDLIDLADLNYAESIREVARWRADSEIIEQNDLLLVAGGGKTPVTNSAMPLGNQAGPPADALLERVRGYFGNKSIGYSFRLRRHLDFDLERLCQSAEMMKISESPGMSIQEPVRNKDLPFGITIRPIKDKAGTIDFASVVIESYLSLGMPRETAGKIFETPERMLRPYNHLVVAYLNERPVSSAMLIFSHTIAGIYWVGTIESARKKGLAEACTSLVTNEAFRRGASRVILQASKFGEPVYLRLGFKEFTRYPWYMHFRKG